MASIGNYANVLNYKLAVAQVEVSFVVALTTWLLSSER